MTGGDLQSERRLGFSFLYFSPRVVAEHLGWLDRLAHYGYDGAELPVVDASDEELHAMGRALEAVGLSATAVGFATAETNPISPDAAVRQAGVEHLARLAEKAAMMGANLIAGPMHSAYGLFTEEPPSDDERSWCAEVLHAAGERARAFDVTIALEPLNRFECYFLNTASDCAELVRAIDHPNVVGALDTHHAHLEEDDLPGAIRAMGQTLGHVQLSENHRGTPGRGQVDFTKAIEALDDASYAGWLVIEAFSRRDSSFGSALRIWRKLDGGPEEVLAAGARLLGRPI